MTRTGVVIVTYNSSDVIERCLKSCRDLPVVVVDNASKDATCEVVRQSNSRTVTLIPNASNYGFARAVNQGVTALDTELILLLNPDTELQTTVGELEAACLQVGTGLAAGQLTDEKGQAQRGFALRRFPEALTLIFEVLGINRLVAFNPINRSYRCLDLDLTRPAEAEQPPGAFLMFRREVWQRLGGFDTQFRPLWFEDVDFCRRARNLGLRIQYVPAVMGTHQGGHSIAGLDWSEREVFWYVSLLRYASKHFAPYEYRGVGAAVVLGSLLRSVIGMVRWRSLRSIQVYAKIARFAAASLVSGHAGQQELLASYRKVVQ